MSESVVTTATTRTAQVTPPDARVRYRVVDSRPPAATYTVVAHAPTRR